LKREKTTGLCCHTIAEQVDALKRERQRNQKGSAVFSILPICI